MQINIKPQNKLECPICGKLGGNSMKRWHFNNCKHADKLDHI